MQLFCTRALLTASGPPVQPAPVEPQPLYCWTADLITMDCKQLIVITNQYTRYTMVLYGVDKAQLARLPALFIDGLTNQMRLDGFRSQCIEQYWAAAPGVQLVECADRLAAARLHKACARAVAYACPPLPQSLLQPAWSRYVNGERVAVPGTADPAYPLHALADALTERTGGPVWDASGVTLLAAIEMDFLTVERTLCVPLWYTFDRLHLALQEAFCWQEAEPYEFHLPEQGRSVLPSDSPEPADERASLPAALTQLSEWLRPGGEALYRYGYGEEGWDVRLHILRPCAPPDERPCAVCQAGSGEAPPEGIGGEGGYLEFLDALHSPVDPECEALLTEAEQAGWHPFDLDEVNERLRFMLQND